MVLLAERLVNLQQQQPVHRTAVGGAVEILQQSDQAVDAADLEFALGLEGCGEDLCAFVGARLIDHFDVREIYPYHGFFVGCGNAVAQGGRCLLVEQTRQFKHGCFCCQGFSGGAVAANFLPDRRRGLEAHGVIKRQLFELFLVALDAVKIEQHVPGAAVAAVQYVFQQALCRVGLAACIQDCRFVHL